MIGSIRWNLIFGFVAGVLSFVFAMMNQNVLMTALIRGTISLAVMFMLTFIFRWLLALILLDGAAQKPDTIDQEDGQLGSSIDMMTPEEDITWPELNQSSGQEIDTNDATKSFQAFEPPRLVKKDVLGELQATDPNMAAKAIRRLTED